MKMIRVTGKGSGLVYYLNPSQIMCITSFEFGKVEDGGASDPGSQISLACGLALKVSQEPAVVARMIEDDKTGYAR